MTARAGGMILLNKLKKMKHFKEKINEKASDSYYYSSHHLYSIA
jgi:hypothetical protein